MNLSELTNKIYAEGVEKGNAEAQQIVAKAQEEAAAIVAKAQKEADAKVAAAEAKAAELDKNTRAELKLFAEQSCGQREGRYRRRCVYAKHHRQTG